jgi:hypothetical protein
MERQSRVQTAGPDTDHLPSPWRESRPFLFFRLRRLLRDPGGLPLSSPSSFTFTIRDNERVFSILPSREQGLLVAHEGAGDLVSDLKLFWFGLAPGA